MGKNDSKKNANKEHDRKKSDIEKPEARMDYRAFLREELRRMGFKSQREASQRLEVSAPYLSMVLTGKKGISQSKAFEIATKLGWSAVKRDRFVAMARLGEQSDPDSREALLREGSIEESTLDMELDRYRVVADWYHGALYKLVNRGVGLRVREMARKLGINVETAEVGIERLVSVGLLRQKASDTYETVNRPVRAPEAPSRAIRRFHQQMLQKAQSSNETAPITDKDFSCLLLDLEPQDIPELKRVLDEFRQKLKKFESTGKDARLYAICMQAFRLED